MTAFTVDIADIFDAPGLSVEVDAEWALDTLVVGDESFVLTQPAHVRASVANAGAGFVATGSVTADVTATCSRCLCEFPYRISGEIEGFFTRPGERPGDDDTGPVSPDETVELAPALMAALVVEAPFAPLHAPDCAGLCAECGADLNVETCRCEPAPDLGHPFAGLVALLEDDEGEPGE